VITVTSPGAATTEEVGGAAAACVGAGEVVLLVGELGAGKTTFARGFGRALGVEEAITSPTFTLMAGYGGERARLVHLDAWRLGNLRELRDLGLEEALDDGAIVIVEWGDVVAPVLGEGALVVSIEDGPGDDERLVVLDPGDTTWSHRLGPAVERMRRAGLDPVVSAVAAR
jgi:tRNA threonylcarbamoyladenosine biosynthesis protein TsaE